MSIQPSFREHCGKGRGKKKTKDGEGCYEMSSGHDMAVAFINSSYGHLHRTQPTRSVNILASTTNWTQCIKKRKKRRKHEGEGVLVRGCIGIECGGVMIKVYMYETVKK